MKNGINHFISERISHFNKMLPLSATFFIYLFGWALITPIFNIRINDITGSVFLSGIIFSMLGFTMMLFDPNVGRLCDRFNPKRILQISLLAYCLVFFAYTLANSFISLFFVRMLHGVSCSLLWISGWTLVRKESRGKSSQEKLGFWLMVQNIPYIIGPIIGGLIISMFNYKPAFYLASSLSLGAFIYATLFVKSPKVTDGVKNIGFITQVKNFFSKPESYRIAFLAFLTVFVGVGFAEFMAINMNNKGLSIEEISFALATAVPLPYILFPAIIGVISDKYGRKVPSLIGVLLMCLGLFLFSNADSFTKFVLYAFLFHTGYIFVMTSVNAELNDMIKSSDTGSSIGVFEMIKDAGAATGPIIFGLIASMIGFSNIYLVFLIISLLSIPVIKDFKEY